MAEPEPMGYPPDPNTPLPGTTQDIPVPLCGPTDETLRRTSVTSGSDPTVGLRDELNEFRRLMRQDLREELRLALGEPRLGGGGGGGDTVVGLASRFSANDNTSPDQKGYFLSQLAKREAQWAADDEEHLFDFRDLLPDLPFFNRERSKPARESTSTIATIATPIELVNSQPAGEAAEEPSFVTERSSLKSDSITSNLQRSVDNSPGGCQSSTRSINSSVAAKRQNRAALDRVRDDISLFDWCMGMVRNHMIDAIDDKASAHRRLIHRVLRLPFFELFIMVLICANTITIGIQTNRMAHEETGICAYPPLREVEIVFCIIFSVEIFVRIYVYRSCFFWMPGCAWNYFDLAVVCIQIAEELLMEIAVRTDASFGTCQNSSGTILRIVRILRATRVFRVLRVMRVTQELRLLISCVAVSMRSFLWALAMIAVMIYIISIYIVQAITSHRLENPDTDNEALIKWFGTVPRCVLSLFEALTGGVDWDDLARPLGEQVSYWLQGFFVIYIAFYVLAVLNVVTGIFVETAIDRANDVKALSRIYHARRLFRALDLDGNGNVIFQEVRRRLNSDHSNKELREYFKQIDVDPSEAEHLFSMLDINDSGTIDLEEFLSGCLRMQGPAKALDLLLMTRESRCNGDRMKRVLWAVQDQLDKVVDLLQNSFGADAGALTPIKRTSRTSRTSRVFS